MNNTPQLKFGQRLLLLISLTIQHIVITFSCAMCFWVVCAWCANLSPWLELTVHFSVHALAVTCIVIPILWVTKHRRTAVVCCFIVSWFAYLVQPWSFFESQLSPKQEVLHVLSWNVLANNDEFDSIVEVIRNVNPDILVIIEVRPDLIERAAWITQEYPNYKAIPTWGGAGIGVFSRDNSVKFTVHNFATKVMPSIVATITSADGERQVDLIATHTFSPTPPQRATVRDKQLRAMLEWSEKQTMPQCIVGDLNTTPWTRSFWEIERAGFRDSRRGSGNCASWPAFVGAAGIPIDHALTRGDCVITDRKVLKDFGGSDHRPIEFKLSF